MNQNKYSRLLQILKKCGIQDADNLVLEFKQFMKYQKLNKEIDNMVDEAHQKKISDEEFKSMIDEQKQIMKDLGIRNIKFKEPPSSVNKPVLPNKNNSSPTSNQPKKPVLPNKNNSSPTSNQTKKEEPKVQVFNITDIKNYNIRGNTYIFYGPNNEIIKNVRLDSGEVKSVKELSMEELENISDDLDITVNTEVFQPLDPENKKTQKAIPKRKNVLEVKQAKKSKKNIPKKAKLPKKKSTTPKKKSTTPKKKSTTPKKKSTTPKKKSTTPKKKSRVYRTNKYWYHKLPDYPMKNVSKVKGKRRRIIKTTPKISPEINKKGDRVPFKGFLDMFKI